MNDMGEKTAVRISLDGALKDLLRAAVENPTEPDATSYARINAVFDHRMAPHRQLTWALAEVEVLKRRLKAGLRGHAPDGVGEVDSTRAPTLGEAHL